jgi:hypothetical protein
VAIAAVKVNYVILAHCTYANEREIAERLWAFSQKVVGEKFPLIWIEIMKGASTHPEHIRGVIFLSVLTFDRS